jgi:hypothetical protein
VQTSKNLGFAAAILLLSISVGCSTRLDRHWGEAQRDVIARQIAHPNPQEADPVMDGVTVEAAVAKHRRADRSIDTQQPLINMIGGGSDDY